MQRLLKLYRKEGLDVKVNVSLSRYTTWQIGGPARVMVHPRNAFELFKAIDIAHDLSIPTFFLGGGSNLLVSDKGFSGVVINLRGLKAFRYLNDGLVEADAGVLVSSLLSFCAEKGLSGLEFLAGVPATVGGAVAMNAGAFGKEVKDVLKEVCALYKGAFHTYKASELSFTYRSWGGPEDALIVKAIFSFKQSSSDEVQQKISVFLAQRKKSQPLSYPTAGCVFRNPKEAPAGFLIEKVGLKGFTIGGASFSKKHANFIINRGGAKARDVLDLIEHAKEKVFRAFGIELREEVIIVGQT